MEIKTPPPTPMRAFQHDQIRSVSIRCSSNCWKRFRRRNPDGRKRSASAGSVPLRWTSPKSMTTRLRSNWRSRLQERPPT